MDWNVLKNFFLVGPPKSPPGGYFGDFLAIFINLGLKQPKMSQEIKFLLQNRYILPNWNITFFRVVLVMPPGHPPVGHTWLNFA